MGVHVPEIIVMLQNMCLDQEWKALAMRSPEILRSMVLTQAPSLCCSFPLTLMGSVHLTRRD
jgi:hypothetical protein